MKRLKKNATTHRISRAIAYLTFAIAVLPFVALAFFLVSERGGATAEAVSAPAGTEAGQAEARATVGISSARYTVQQPATPLPQVTRVGYDVSILKALREMNLNVDHFDAWLDVHPDSALKHLRFMPVSMQRDVAGIALFIRKSNGKVDAKTAWREAVALVHYSAKYGVPSALTTAVAHAESTFNPDAVSSKGASGVMQVMWRVHNGLLQANGIHPAKGSTPLSDPEQGIAAGCLLLSRYIRAYGSVQSAMERYYGGKSDAYQRKIDRNIARILDHHAELRFD